MEELLIAQISDLHVGKVNFLPEKLETCIEEVNGLNPDLVVVSGDLTGFGFKEEYLKAKEYLDMLKPKKFIIPGNHDARYRGDIYFERLFGHGNKTLNLENIGVVGLDSTVPDLDEGNLGRGKQRWLRKQLKKIPGEKVKAVVIHHHLVPVPLTGRERSVLTDAGDILKILAEEGVDLVMSGHRHTPYSWFLNNMAIVTAGSPSTEKVRATIPQSYNIIKVNEKWIDIRVKEVAGKEVMMARYTREAGRHEFRLEELEEPI